MKITSSIGDDRPRKLYLAMLAAFDRFDIEWSRFYDEFIYEPVQHEDGTYDELTFIDMLHTIEVNDGLKTPITIQNIENYMDDYDTDWRETSSKEHYNDLVKTAKKYKIIK